MKTRLLAFIVAVMLPIVAMSQFTLSGKIKDAVTGEKLVSANVFLLNTYTLMQTDQQGGFTINNLKGGNYTLKITFLGYKTDTIVVNLDKNINLDLGLIKSSILQDEVIISSTRAGERTPSTFQNISKKEIESMNTGVDIPYLIENTPSVVVTSDAGTGIGYTNIHIRGSDLTRTNVMVNGIPLNDAESHGVYFVDLPDMASSIDNLQIQRGVGTSVNGAGAFGASINFQTLTLNPKAYAESNNTYGSFNTWKNTICFGTGLIDNKWAIDGRLSKISSDGYIDRASSELHSYYLSGAYYGKKTIVKFITFSGVEKTYQAWGGVPSDSLATNRTYNSMGEHYDAYGNIVYYANETDNYQQDHYQLLMSHEINNNWNVNAALHYTKGYGYYEEYKSNQTYGAYGLPFVTTGNDTMIYSDLIRRKILDNDFYGVTYSVNYNSHKKLSVNIGGGYNIYDGDNFGNIIWMQFAGNVPINFEWYRNNGLKKDFNIYGKVNYQLTNKLSIYGDLQYRNINYTIIGINDNLDSLNFSQKFNFINPKFGAFYQLDQNSDFYLSFAIANREPNRSNYVDANTTKPLPVNENLKNAEFGYSLRLSNIYVKANVFYMLYKDQLVLTGQINDVGNAVMTNVPESYRYGLEISVGAKPISKLRWDVNLALSQNKIKNFTEYVDDWDTWTQRVTNLGTTDLSFSPNIILSNQLSYDVIRNFSIGLNTKYIGKQYIDNTSNEDRILKPYLINNLRLNYSLKTNFIKKIDFFVTINNIFDVKYESNAWVYQYYEGNIHKKMDGYYPQAGVNYLIGLNLKL